MLDDLFAGAVVLSFLALCTFGSISSVAPEGETAAKNTIQLERVLVTGKSVKAESRA